MGWPSRAFVSYSVTHSPPFSSQSLYKGRGINQVPWSSFLTLPFPFNDLATLRLNIGLTLPTSDYLNLLNSIINQIIISSKINNVKTGPGNLVDATPLIQALGGKGV